MPVYRGSIGHLGVHKKIPYALPGGKIKFCLTKAKNVSEYLKFLFSYGGAFCSA